MAPAHHVTIRHVVGRDTAALGSYRGAFNIPGPSHEIAFQYIESHGNGAGTEASQAEEAARGD